MVSTADYYQNLRGVRKLSRQDSDALEKLKAFENLVYLPIAKRIDIEQQQLIQFFDVHKKDVDTFHTSGLWKGIKPISGPHCDDPNYKIDPAFSEEFSDFIEQVYDRLPLSKIHMMQFWEQNFDINDHQDGSAADMGYLFPFSYRILAVSGHEKSFYIKPFSGANSLPYSGSSIKKQLSYQPNPHFIDLPNDTNVFCFNNSACMHGAKKIRERKIIVFIDAEIDFVRHYKLVRDSIEKYSNYTIFKNVDEKQ